MDTEAECYWMTDQLRMLLEAIPEEDWTMDLSLASEVRQDFHDMTCRWESRQPPWADPSDGQPAPKPDPEKFRKAMTVFGFVIDPENKTCRYEPAPRLEVVK
jgi:hypothetical protein